MTKRNPGLTLRAATVLFFTLIFLSTLYTSDTSAQEKKAEKPAHTYTFISLTTSRLGESSRIDIIGMMESLSEDLYKKTGVKMIFKDTSHMDPSSGFIKEKADLAFLGLEDILRLEKQQIELEPLVLASIFKSPGVRLCIYADEKYSDLKSLKGASLNIQGSRGVNTSYMATRKIMLENGIDMPVREFFGDIYKIPDADSSCQALLLGKISAIATADWLYEFYSKNLPGIESIKTIACSIEYPYNGIFMRKGLDRSDTDKLKKYFKKLHKNPLLKEFRTVILALNVKFVDPDPVLMENIEGLYDEAKKKGWLDEAKKFIAKMKEIDYGQALKLEPKTYKECKAECKDVEAEDLGSCLDKCMGE